MKKLLITGGSHSEYPVIEAAKNIQSNSNANIKNQAGM